MSRKRSTVTNEFPNKDNFSEMINENIKELGVPHLPPETVSNIHCLTIVGQIEGHLILPPQNMSILFRNLLRWNKVQKLKDC